MVVLGSVHMFSDQYLDKEENAKVQVRFLVIFLVKLLTTNSGIQTVLKNVVRIPRKLSGLDLQCFHIIIIKFIFC